MNPPARSRIGDRVAEVIRTLESQIDSGVYLPGSRLPSERQISERLAVSRSVVREALNRLESQGTVSTRHGSGTVVQSPTTKPASEALERLLRRTPTGLPELIEVRLCLETTIAALAAQRRTDDNLRRLEETVAVLAQAGRKLDDFIAADLDFHAELAKAAGNSVFTAVLAPVQAMLAIGRRKTLSVDGPAIALADHRKILDRIRAKDAEGARKLMAEHLGHAAAAMRQP